MNSLRAIVRFLAVPVLAGLALAFVLVNVWPTLKDTPEPQPAEPQAPAPAAPASYAEAVNRAAPSVVSIYTQRVEMQEINPRLQQLLGRSHLARSRRDVGSGVLVSSDGYILTNEHVISEVQNIQVALWDGRFSPAEVVGTDPGTDLAVLKIPFQDLPAAPFATGEGPNVGDVVLAIGNALGLSHTVTMGIVSATGRNALRSVLYEDFIQTDAAINSGNSGGALVNAHGEVIGINARNLGAASGAENIGFAIPISLARNVLQQIIAYGTVRRGWLGATFSELPLRLQPDGSAVREGVLVREVTSDGPAWVSGIRAGDVLLELDGEPVSDARATLLALAARSPGTRVELLVQRGEQQFQTYARLIQQPPVR